MTSLFVISRRKTMSSLLCCRIQGLSRSPCFFNRGTSPKVKFKRVGKIMTLLKSRHVFVRLLTAFVMDVASECFSWYPNRCVRRYSHFSEKQRHDYELERTRIVNECQLSVLKGAFFSAWGTSGALLRHSYLPRAFSNTYLRLCSKYILVFSPGPGKCCFIYRGFRQATETRQTRDS